MLLKFMITGALLAASPALAQQGPDRYALDLSVVRDGLEVVSVRTLLSEQSPAEATVSDGDGVYAVNAEIKSAQGDGEGHVVLSANIDRNGADVASPIMTFRRSGTARMEVGSEGGDRVTMTVSPVGTPAD